MKLQKVRQKKNSIQKKKKTHQNIDPVRNNCLTELFLTEASKMVAQQPKHGLHTV